jgi:hypothetical protein
MMALSSASPALINYRSLKCRGFYPFKDVLGAVSNGVGRRRIPVGEFVVRVLRDQRVGPRPPQLSSYAYRFFRNQL